MLITRISFASGIERTREINITDEQLALWKNGMLIQQAMPNITPGEREFILTGTTEEEWAEMFKDDDDDDDDSDDDDDKEEGEFKLPPNIEGKEVSNYSLNDDKKDKRIRWNYKGNRNV